MAVSSVTVVVTKAFKDSASYRAYGTVSIGASPGTYPTGGYTFPLTDFKLKAGRLPAIVKVEGTSGFVYRFVPGTTVANGKLMVFTGAAAQSPLTELAAGATPAGVSGDTISWNAEWSAML